MYICKSCEKDPSSHSFFKLHEIKQHGVFYSCDAESTDKDVDNIMQHIEGVLEEFHMTGTTWEWIFDGKDFSISFHSLALSSRFIDLLKKYQRSLTKIHVIHTNEFVKTIFDMMTPFLSDQLISIIHMKS